MVELVLGDTGRQFLELESHVGAGLVLRLDRHRNRPLDRDQHTLHRQAAFVGDHELVHALDDARVDERAQVGLLVLEDEQASQDSDLGPGEPDPARVDHQRLHPLDKAAEIGVELLDGLCLHPQNRIGVLADLSEREAAPRLRLGIQLDVANLALILAHAQGVYGPQHCVKWFGEIDERVDRSFQTDARAEPARPDAGTASGALGMDRRERLAIMSEGAIRKDDPRVRAQGDRLADEIDGSPLKGRRIRQRLKNFATGADNYVASMGGPLPWMQRRRMIEDETTLHERRLALARRDVAETCGSEEEFARRWGATAARWSFHAVNELIEKHNRNFPAESRLPMDPRTGDFVRLNGKPYRLEPLDSDWILRLFPVSGLNALRIDVDDHG